MILPGDHYYPQHPAQDLHRHADDRAAMGRQRRHWKSGEMARQRERRRYEHDDSVQFYKAARPKNAFASLLQLDDTVELERELVRAHQRQEQEQHAHYQHFHRGHEQRANLRNGNHAMSAVAAGSKAAAAASKLLHQMFSGLSNDVLLPNSMLQQGAGLRADDAEEATPAAGGGATTAGAEGTAAAGGDSTTAAAAAGGATTAAPAGGLDKVVVKHEKETTTTEVCMYLALILVVAGLVGFMYLYNWRRWPFIRRLLLCIRWDKFAEIKISVTIHDLIPFNLSAKDKRKCTENMIFQCRAISVSTAPGGLRTHIPPSRWTESHRSHKFRFPHVFPDSSAQAA